VDTLNFVLQLVVGILHLTKKFSFTQHASKKYLPHFIL